MDSKQKWTDIVTKAWADEQFKQRLLADPASVLKENGVTVPAGLTVNVIENTDVVYNLILPLKPRQATELTEDELENIAAGRTAGGQTLDVIDVSNYIATGRR